MEKFHTLCSLDCWDACSIQLTVEDNQIKRISGNPDHPITQGFLCKKGMAHAQRVNHSHRLQAPQKKVNGKWISISWEQAIQEIAGHFKSVLTHYGSESILHYAESGHGGLGKNIDVAFLNSLGKVAFPTGSLCWGAGMAAQKQDFGKVLSHGPQDHLNSKTILIWGRNPANTNMHLLPYLKQAKAQGTSIVVIDPIRTATVDYATHHYQLLPESDGALALALAKIIFENHWHHPDFIDKHTHGFPTYLEKLASLKLEALISATGLTSEEVYELAHLYGKNSPASIILGFGLQRYPHGGMNIRYIDALAALTGNIGLSGGGVSYANQYVKQWIDWDYVENTPIEPPLTYVRSAFPQYVLEDRKNQIQLMLITKANPLVQLPNTTKVIEAMEAIPVKITLDHFMSDTAQYSDYVLPCTHIFEEEDFIFTSMWHDHYGLTEPALTPYAYAKEEFEIFTLLAEALEMNGFLAQYPSKQIYLEKALAPLLEKVQRPFEALRGTYQKLEGNDVPWAEKNFATCTGNFHFAVPNIVTRQVPADYPLQLLSLHPKHSLHSQHFLDTPSGTLPTIYLAPATMAAYQLKAGQQVEVASSYGQILALVAEDQNVTKDLLVIYEGWWHKQQCVNLLTSPEVSDMGNQAIYNHCFCRVTPCL